ncbi:hypothetical protein [Streptomyces sp. VRA16 Mangrove soil]|uniref:hypothetical protein n=1 Tax=Streptomyces sp. VRA16 Mangrove soil TaxID=2817434 RepID=UPI001A9EBD19|nr:hypothetical protein [Streptomyces sp. VRA16 Mangrove soil]MBO1331108.1 hypothetical protein [Streptomyces sp. VRA16 Mangrove soil]
MTVDVLLIGGRSGAGKSSVGWEVAALLRAADLAHAYIEGDFLDAAHPADPSFAGRNLAALWDTYRSAGLRRLVYTNTASVLASEAGLFTAALAPGPVRIVRVLLTASDATVRTRLRAREQGSELEQQLRRSATMAGRLEAGVPAGTVRIATDARTVPQVARTVLDATGWAA